MNRCILLFCISLILASSLRAEQGEVGRTASIDVLELRDSLLRDWDHWKSTPARGMSMELYDRCYQFDAWLEAVNATFSPEERDQRSYEQVVNWRKEVNALFLRDRDAKSSLERFAIGQEALKLASQWDGIDLFKVTPKPGQEVVVKISGLVAKPQILRGHRKLTLGQAIKLTGGLLPEATAQSISLYRAGKGYLVNLRYQENIDLPLVAGDLIGVSKPIAGAIAYVDDFTPAERRNEPSGDPFAGDDGDGFGSGDPFDSTPKVFDRGLSESLLPSRTELRRTSWLMSDYDELWWQRPRSKLPVPKEKEVGMSFAEALNTAKPWVDRIIKGEPSNGVYADFLNQKFTDAWVYQAMADQLIMADAEEYTDLAVKLMSNLNELPSSKSWAWRQQCLWAEFHGIDHPFTAPDNTVWSGGDWLRGVEAIKHGPMMEWLEAELTRLHLELGLSSEQITKAAKCLLALEYLKREANHGAWRGLDLMIEVEEFRLPTSIEIELEPAETPEFTAHSVELVNAKLASFKGLHRCLVPFISTGTHQLKLVGRTGEKVSLKIYRNWGRPNQTSEHRIIEISPDPIPIVIN